ncbi:hypothetical protein ACFOET_06910 [Parapedobacter deserti]|uniref:Uncharacterized protein n=1 Tax=Parapedobacter deserti TaxID=1912957 RepID=A0ABV7JPU0_9SPHI
MFKPPIYLKSGALLLALLLAVIIGVLTGGLLLLLQYHRQYAAQAFRHERLQRNLHSATGLLLTQETTIYGDTTAMDLFGDGRDSAILIRRPWGAFDVGITYTYEQRDTLSSTFLIGRVLTDSERYALYLADENRPLSISGETRIQGDAFLPEAGIRKSYIENQAYAYDEVIHGGTMRHSGANLPALNSAIIERLAKYLQPASEAEWVISARDWFVATAGDSLHQPFHDRPLVLHGLDSITVSGLSITGQIIIVADRAVTVAADALLDNILLFAPAIRFADGFKGRLQAFARDSLVVGRECTFGFPSILGLVNIPKDSIVYAFQPLVRIDSASVVNGLVFSHFPGSEQLLANVMIGKSAIVNGQVYAGGLLELKGTVNGITLCRRFTLQTPSSLYENFVLNGVMDLTGLSPHYAGSPLLNAGRLGKVLNWLDKKNDEQSIRTSYASSPLP